MAGDPELIKVRLTDRGQDSETPWAHDLGPAPGPPGSRKVRLANVPFMHAKPTWGDVIVVTPVEDDFPVWDRGGVPWEQIETRIAEDGGRWAMIVDYAAHSGSEDAFGALVHACAENEIVCEGAWGPRDGKPGRAYLAVKHELDDLAVMKCLRAAKLPCEVIQIHPEPAAKAVVVKPAAKPVVTKRAATKPATASAAPRNVSVSKPSVSKPSVSKPSVSKPSVSKPATAKTAAAKAGSKQPASGRSSDKQRLSRTPAAAKSTAKSRTTTTARAKPR